MRALPTATGNEAREVEFHLSENPDGVSYRVIRDDLFDVTGAHIPRVWRLQQGSDRTWGLEVVPSGLGEVTLRVRPTTACGGSPGICAPDGRMLEGGLVATVSDLPALSVADATVAEAPGARLAFAVTLDRAPQAAVTVDYATR